MLLLLFLYLALEGGKEEKSLFEQLGGIYHEENILFHAKHEKSLVNQEEKSSYLYT